MAHGALYGLQLGWVEQTVVSGVASALAAMGGDGDIGGHLAAEGKLAVVPTRPFAGG